MKVCMTYSYLTPHIGGVEHHMELLGRALAAKGVEVSFIVSERSGPNDEFPATYCWTPFDLFRVPIMPAFPLRALQADYDIIHTHATMPFVSDSSILVSKLKRTPCVVTYHFEGNASSPIGHSLAYVYNRFLSRFMLRFADRITVTTESYGDQCTALVGYDVDIIPNPIDVEKYDPANARSEVLERYGLEDTKYLLFLGRIAPYKSLEVLIEAFILLHEIYPDLHLVLAGEIRDEAYHKELVTMARNYRVDERIVFTGTVAHEDLPSLYAHCETYVLPSLETGEAFGMTTVEAALSGARVVTADKPGVKDVAKLVNGITFAVDRPVFNLTEALIQSLRSSKPNIEAVRMTFSPESIADRVIGIYESVL